jgi:hypothetical protein
MRKWLWAVASAVVGMIIAGKGGDISIFEMLPFVSICALVGFVIGTFIDSVEQTKRTKNPKNAGKPNVGKIQ